MGQLCLGQLCFWFCCCVEQLVDGEGVGGEGVGGEEDDEHEEDDVVEGVSVVTTVVVGGVATVVLEHDDGFSTVSSTTPSLTFTGRFCVFVDSRGLVFATKTPDCDAFGPDNNDAVSLPLKFRSFPTTIGGFGTEETVFALVRLLSVIVDSCVLITAGTTVGTTVASGFAGFAGF